MFGIGSTELLVILLVGLIVLGPKSLASVSRTLGKVIGEFRRVSTDFQRTLNAEAAAEEASKTQNSSIADANSKSSTNQNSEIEREESPLSEEEEQAIRQAKLEARKAEALAKAKAAKNAKMANSDKVDLNKPKPESNADSPKEMSPLDKALAKAHAEAMAYDAQETGSTDSVKKA